MQRLLILFSLGLLAWQSPALLASWQHNRLALQTRAVCFQTATGQPGGAAAAASSAGPAWAAAMQAHCRGDQNSEQAAWRAVIAASESRLSLAHAAAHDDFELARLSAETYPHNPKAWLWLAELLEKQGSREAAVLAYRTALEYRPYDGVLWVRVGNLLEQQNDPQAAILAFERACALQDLGGNGCYRAGLLYLQQQLYDQAAGHFYNALAQIGSAYRPAELGLARALAGQGQTAEAIQRLQPLAEAGDGEARRLIDQLQGPAAAP